MRLLISLTLVVTIIFGCFSGCSEEKTGSLTIFGADNQQIVKLSSKDDIKTTDISFAYTDAVFEEVTEIFASIYNCSTEDASKKIFEGDYTVYTYYQSEITKVISDTYNQGAYSFDFACAVTDLNGNVVAVYSSPSKDGERVNNAVSPKSPYSSLKPLSVYAPAMDAGIINWSTQFEDSPYKKITEVGKGETSWPQNVTGMYTNKDISVAQGVKESINTVAVKCLKEYGAEKSLDFLKNKLHMNVTLEQTKLDEFGDEEVLGNLALGYLTAGVSPVDMAGYYTIFANGGKYSSPTTISKICDASGKEIYLNNLQSEQVISSQTSYIMNEMLQTVTEPGGTGYKANNKNSPVACKTGTGDNFNDNWTVGVTPVYSCSVWHSSGAQKNISSELFSQIISGIKIDNKLFMTDKDVEEQIICSETGLLFGNGCTSIEVGYYAKGEALGVCNKH